MNCQNCGTPIPDGTRFCPNCGAEQTAPQAPQEAAPAPQPAPQEAPAYQPAPQETAPAPVFCARCGNPVPAGAPFCGSCGAPVGGEASQKKSKKALFIGIAAAAVAVVALVVILIVALSGGSNSSPEQVARTFLESTQKMDFDKAVECFTDAYLRQMTGSEEGTSRSKLIEAAKKKMKEEQEDSPIDLGEFIKNLKIEFTVKEVIDDQDDSKLKPYIEAAKNGEYGFTDDELDSIQEYAIVSAEVTVSMPLFGENTDTQDIACVKMGGDWYILGSGDSNDSPFDYEEPTFEFDTEDDGDFGFDF